MLDVDDNPAGPTDCLSERDLGSLAAPTQRLALEPSGELIAPAAQCSIGIVRAPGAGGRVPGASEYCRLTITSSEPD